jgi:hypothetical protein
VNGCIWLIDIKCDSEWWVYVYKDGMRIDNIKANKKKSVNNKNI